MSRKESIMGKTTRGAAAIMAAVAVAACAPSRASAETGQVRYVMRADGPWQAVISYRIAPPSGSGGGGDHDNVFLDPDNPWETTVELENPYRWANVSIANYSSWVDEPSFHCEIWIDGRLATKGAGNCSARNG